MQKIGDITNTADPQGEFTDGNVAQGVTPTILPAAMFNTWQREMINVVENAGIELDPENDGQLVEAIRALITSWSTSNVKKVNSKLPDENGNIQLSAGDTGALSSDANAVSASKLFTARRIGGTQFDGTTDITPANCTTAVQATKLQISRAIAGVGFDGTGSISIPAGNVGAYTKAEVDALVNSRGAKNTASIATNGWSRDGDTGLIHQWGMVGKGAGNVAITFPIPFPTACYNMSNTVYGGGGELNLSSIVSFSRTGATIGRDQNGAFWQAWGK